MRNPFHLLPGRISLEKHLKDEQIVEAPKIHGLFALQNKPIYTGTVPPHIKAQRRARNKVARRSRRINRLRGH